MALPKAQTSSARFFTLAALAGLISGAAWLYYRQEADPLVDAACKAMLQTAQAMQPKGELAAFIPAQRARRLPALNFTSDAGDVTSDALRGKTVLYNIWATWCVPCREEMPALDKLQALRGGERFTIAPISIDTDDGEKQKAFYRDIKIASLPLYRDSSGAGFQALRAGGFGAGVPLSVLVDAQGCVLGHLSGPADWASADALAIIDFVLKK